MFVVIQHHITDPQKWNEVAGKIGSVIEQGRLPKGLKGLFYLPSVDGRKATCAWEADSMENLKRFLEPQTGTASRNEYYQVNAEHAMGLPVQKPEYATAH